MIIALYMNDFEKTATSFVLDTAKTHILLDFNNDRKDNKTINYINYNYQVTISRRCFHDSDPSAYFEDYCVEFTGKFQDKLLQSGFYMDWKDNIVGGELLPANTRWNPDTNEFTQRSIKIRYTDLIDDP